MSTHKTVVTDTLTHFYAKLQNPLASDKERMRISLLALDQMEPDESEFTLQGMNIASVQNAVEEGKISAEDALAYEEEHDNRKTLVSWLEERV